MLDELLAGQGFPKASPSIADPKHACGTTKPSTITILALDVGLNLQAGRDYRENIRDPKTARTGDVNGRPAIEEPAPLGSPGQCSILMSVKPNSRAILDVTSGSDTKAACSTARELATKFEPKLPQG
ncbi:hypothetical protein [Amycolatopsis sulphurea]|uniref:hypothetical protein n=1 Tax=Amycolatopsis sulphurea TaxID=76022 RepID=UPI000BF526F4|nr:hypothetical protein [Amycolatopsis sulphurea]